MDKETGSCKNEAESQCIDCKIRKREMKTRSEVTANGVYTSSKSGILWAIKLSS